LRLRRRDISPYRLYLILESGTAFLLGVSYATVTVYWVTAGRLNPLQLLLLGTALEGSYFLFQLPTGLLADLVSTRLCVLAGLFVVTHLCTRRCGRRGDAGTALSPASHHEPSRERRQPVSPAPCGAGAVASIRIALLVGAAALAPAAAFIAAASRRIAPRTAGTVAEAEAVGAAPTGG
jgi:hypothetical protein